MTDDDLDFYPFDSSDLPPAEHQRGEGNPRPSARDRAKAGPRGVNRDDAAVAERDNRRAMGRR